MTTPPATIENGTDADATVVQAWFDYLLGLIEAVPTPTSLTVVSSEAITAPAFVGINSSFQVVQANAANGVEVVGYILTNAALGNPVTVYLAGQCPGFSGLVGGPVFLGAGGLPANVPPSTPGDYVQQIGWAISATTITFQPQTMIGPL